MTTSFKLTLAEGTWIQGKWNKNKYEIIRLLGEGANGQVYLVRSSKALLALKIGFDAIDLQLEVNVLKSLSKGPNADHFLQDSDNLVMGERSHPFYVMKYVKGIHPQLYLQRHGMDWFGLIHYGILKKLVNLHRRNYIFGDLKTDNVLVSDFGKIELVDFGGVTEKGRAVKQFTEVYDRGFWNAGSRKADEAYDLFSFAVLCLYLSDSQNRFAEFVKSVPQNRSLEDLIALTNENDCCSRFKPVLEKALTGQYKTSQEAEQEWRLLMLKSSGGGLKIRKSSLWIQTAFAVSLVLFISTLYIFLQS